MRHTARTFALGLALAALVAGVAVAETIKLAVGQRGNWDTAVAELGQQAGIFRKHGLELDILYTQGGGETQQAVLTRSVQVGVAAGTLGVLGAAARGAPLRIIGAEITGASDIYWYVPTASPVRTPADLAGRSVAYSTNGSSSHAVLLMQQATIQGSQGGGLKPVATGTAPSTYTQAMSGQVDVGWANPPFGIEQLDRTIRIVFRGSDLPDTREQTVRVLITHAAELAERGGMIDRFMAGYRETLDWMYANSDAIPTYARFAGISEAVARRTRDEFFPKAVLDTGRVTGLDRLMADAVAFKFLAAPLTAAQLEQVLQIRSSPR